MDIRLDFISSDTLASKGSVEKIRLILERIKKNIIVVLEEGLSPQEEASLIEATMQEINAEDFHGIEFHRIDHKDAGFRDKIASYISGRKSGLTIVGPTRMVEAIKKEPEGLSMFAKVEKKAKKKKGKKVEVRPGGVAPVEAANPSEPASKV